MIHPGSVMFRADPQFIVAGEIVRTSRMYAMSVSPLSKAVLSRIGLGDNSNFISQRHGDAEDAEKRREKRDKKEKRVRDFTNNIKIKSEVFEIITVKGKKTVLLPWERLKNIREELSNYSRGETVYKGLKGKVIVKKQSNTIEYNSPEYYLLEGEKLELILSIVPTLDADKIISL